MKSVSCKLKSLKLLQRVSSASTNFLRDSSIYRNKQKNKPRRSPSLNYEAYFQDVKKVLQEEIKCENSLIDSCLASGSGLVDLERKGLCLGDLEYHSSGHSLFDGEYFVFTRRTRSTHFQKWLKTGSPAVIDVTRDGELAKLADCTILSASNDQIKVRMTSSLKNEDYDSARSGTFSLKPSQTSGSMHTLVAFLEENSIKSSNGSELVKLAFRGTLMPSIHDRQLQHLHRDWNPSQVCAISAAMNPQRPFLCIQGPPGTGKTRLIAEIITQLVDKGKKVLVCAPSNVAVDGVWAAAVQHRNKTRNRESTTEVDGAFIREEMMSEEIQRDENYGELLKAFNNYKEIYSCKSAVFCTISSSIARTLPKLKWNADVIIIDEAAQAIEPATWAAIIAAKRCILVGDPAQLPAVVKSEAGRKAKLDVSLMSRLLRDFSSRNIGVLLSEQYRSNHEIVRWPSERFYDARLSSHASVANSRLSDKYDVNEGDVRNLPLLMLNTDGDVHRTGERPVQRSKVNYDETQLVARYVQFLLQVGVKPSEMAIIAPYAAQVDLLRKVIKNDSIAINSVDAFQGQEREVVVMSLTRDNEKGNIGFLNDQRRLNVAITRAKRQFVLVGSASLMRHDPHMNSFLGFLTENGYVHDAGVIFENAQDGRQKGRIRV